MGFRFRKILNILPGLRVNLSKNGFSSITIGVPGLNINLGKDGSKRGTIGIPGTGLFFTKTLSDNKNRK